MQIGVANAAGFGLHQDLAGAGAGDLELPHHQRFAELLDDGGMHCVSHGEELSKREKGGSGSFLKKKPKNFSLCCAAWRSNSGRRNKTN
jgi:hypothetical protein